MTTDIGADEDFPEGTMRIVKIDQQEIGVIRLADEFFAIRNGCPHQDAPLCKGAVRRSLSAHAAGEMELEETRPVITCPWHGWAFDLRSGVSVTGDRGRVRGYDVRIDGGRVLLERRRRGRSS